MEGNFNFVLNLQTFGGHHNRGQVGLINGLLEDTYLDPRQSTQRKIHFPSLTP